MEKQGRMTLHELATELEISKMKCRQGIIDGTLPFATYIKPRGEKGKYTFIIWRERFEAWKRGGFIG